MGSFNLPTVPPSEFWYIVPRASVIDMYVYKQPVFINLFIFSHNFTKGDLGLKVG